MDNPLAPCSKSVDSNVRKNIGMQENITGNTVLILNFGMVLIAQNS